MADAVTALRLPGTSGNRFTTPDSASLSLTSNLTAFCLVALDDWTPAALTTLICQWNPTGSQRAWMFNVDTAGKLQFQMSTDGTAVSTVTSSVAPTIADGQKLWVLVSWRSSDGRTQFFTASGAIDEPVASDFSQLGTDQTTTVAAMNNSTANVSIGARSDGVNLAAGKFYKARIRNGVFATSAYPGTVRLDANFLTVVPTAIRTPTSFTESSSNAATVTADSGTTWAWLAAWQLTGSTNGTGGDAGSVKVAHTLTGSAGGTSGASGSLKVARALSGSTGGASSTAGSVKVAHSLTGTTAGVSGTSGSIREADSLTGTTGGTATVSGSLRVAHALTGTAGGTSGASGSVRCARALTGVAGGQSSSSAAIRVARALIGTTGGVSTTAGDLLAQIIANATSTSTVSGRGASAKVAAKYSSTATVTAGSSTSSISDG